MLFVLGSAAILAVGGCSAYSSGGTEEMSASSTRVTTSASPSVPATESQSQVPTEAPPTEAPATQAPPAEVSAEAPPTEPLPSETQPAMPDVVDAVPGDQLMIGNELVTVCGTQGGWGLNVLAVNANTSCDFGFDIADRLIEDIYSTKDNVRGYLPQTFSIWSSVTGGTYEMTCVNQTEALIACRGGNNAAAYFY